MPIEVIDLLKQKNNGNFPLIEAKDVKGGFHQANNIEERDAIPKEKRIEGMYCYVLNDTIYRLLGGIENSNWIAWNVATKQYVDYQIDSVDTLLEGKANTSHVHGWTELTGKPSTFTPTLGTTSSTAFRGDYGNTAYTHSQVAHAPSSAQKNSDITKAEIEAKLIGVITSHTHNYAASNHNHNGTYTRKYAANIGNGTLTTIPVAHNLGTEDVTITVREVATKQIVMVDVQIVDSNNIQILFASAPASASYRVVVVG